MKDIWTNINDNISIYLKKINEQHKISYVKLSSIQTALIGNDFALILSIDRFDVYMSYVYKLNNVFFHLCCDSYFAEKFDDEDRKNLLLGTGAEIYLINNLKIIDSGLTSKWNDMLKGDKEWIKHFTLIHGDKVKLLEEKEKSILEKYI